MKKWTTLFLALLLALCLTACGGASSESIRQGDSILAEVETIYQETVLALEHLDNTSSAEVQTIHDANKTALDALSPAIDALKNAWNENKYSASQEEVDAVVAEFQNMETTLSYLKINIVAQSTSSGKDFILDASGIDFNNIEAYQAPDLDGTRWTMVGGIDDGQQMTQAEYDDMIEILGGYCVLAFYSEGAVVQTEIAGQVVTEGYFMYNHETNADVLLEYDNGQKSMAVFTMLDYQPLMIVFTDESQQNGGYYIPQ